MTLNFQQKLEVRYADAPNLKGDEPANALLNSMISRGACRSFLNKPVPMNRLELLCAAALASPTKSDLQQRDIVLLQSPGKRKKLADLVSGQPWVASAPMIVIFCANNRRQRLLHEWHNVEFANDHLDAFLNAAADAAIALSAFVTATEAIGLGCCPISAVRNEAQAVSELLNLPQHVFPFAGLAIGYPDEQPRITRRLPFSVTCHIDQYQEENLRKKVRTYDADRTRVKPYTTQRLPETFGTKETYGWSDDKVRQYSQQERANFGAYIRAQGFCLD